MNEYKPGQKLETARDVFLALLAGKKIKKGDDMNRVLYLSEHGTLYSDSRSKSSCFITPYGYFNFNKQPNPITDEVYCWEIVE